MVLDLANRGRDPLPLLRLRNEVPNLLLFASERCHTKHLFLYQTYVWDRRKSRLSRNRPLRPLVAANWRSPLTMDLSLRRLAVDDYEQTVWMRPAQKNRHRRGLSHHRQRFRLRWQ